MNLALFDLDNTLLAGDSDHAWAHFLVNEGLLDAKAYEARNNEFFGHYKAGTLNIQEYLEFALSTIANRPAVLLAQWHQRFMQERVHKMMLPKAKALLAEHENDLRIIVTATNSFVAGPIAKAFGVDHFIACDAELVDGVYTGKSTGQPSFREGKIARVNQWLESRNQRLEHFESVFFYSDSLNDLPLLQVVNRPVAVDPDDRLRAHALEAGWPVISLR